LTLRNIAEVSAIKQVKLSLNIMGYLGTVKQKIKTASLAYLCEFLFFRKKYMAKRRGAS
jgi:hypothetical protein